MRHVLSSTEIAKSSDLKRKWVAVPEWSDSGDSNAGVYVREMSVAEHDVMMERFGEASDSNTPGFRVWLLGKCVIDEDGKQVVGSGEATDIFGDRNVNVVSRLVSEILTLNVMTEASLEALEGNSSATPIEDVDSN